MLLTTIKSLLARKLRLLTTGLAVLIGVAFMAGTFVLTDTISATMDSLFADANAGIDGYVRGEAAFESSAAMGGADGRGGDQRPRLDTSLVEEVAGVDGVAAAEGSIEAYAQIVDKDGELIGSAELGIPTYGGNWLTTDELNPFDIAEGRPPETGNEMVIDKGSADDAGYAIGDTATVVTQAGPQEAEIVGIATFGDADNPQATWALLTPETAQEWLTEPGKIDAIKVLAADGVEGGELVARIAQVVPDQVEVLTGAEITAETQNDLKESMGFFNTFLLAFALIALFVGSFIIYNSFSILVAQRSREMALLRAIGANRRQVLGSVLLEAVLVGLVASVLGVVLGVGVGIGLKALMVASGLDVPADGVVLEANTVIVCLIAGLGVSVLSAILPARRAAKIAPVAAMRDAAVDQAPRRQRRLIIGGTVTGLGAAAMASGLFGGGGVAAVGLGAPIVFIGVAVLGPIIATPVSRVLGAPLPRLKGMAGSLARENAMRNPRRTSATAAALMIGVALVGFITILASSTKASIADAVDDAFTGDIAVDSGTFGFGGLSPDLAVQLNDLPEVDAATGVRMTGAEVNGTADMLIGVDPNTVQQIFDFGDIEGSLDDLGASQIAMSVDAAEDAGLEIGETVPVTFTETGEQDLTLAATYTTDDLAGDQLIGFAAYEANVADQFDFTVFVTVADGVESAAALAAVEEVAAAYPQAEVQDRTAYKESQTAEIDLILNMVYALLFLAVLIALLGIANTLALSIFERTRELGLLRAVGMTRRQLRTTVRYESVIIALLGTFLGLLIGVAFGWALVKAMESEGLTAFVIPGGQLVVITVFAVFAGVAAAVLPARRAAKLDVLDAIVAT
jgi:putative ABC transport system permease protein